VPLATAAAHAAPPPDTTEAEISKAASAWISSHCINVTDGVIQCLDPDQTVPQHVQDRMDHNLAQIKSLKQEDFRNAKGIHQQLPAKRKSPTADTEEKADRPSGPTENAPTNDPPAAEDMDANPSNAAENATIEIDAQGDTVKDPIIIDASTSNSDSDSAQDADKSTLTQVAICRE